VPELDDYVARGYFTEGEVKAIAGKRRDFEYRLKRPSPLKADFLAYVDHEKAVDALLRLRRAAAGTRRKSLADRAGPRRVHFIFNRATRKFRGDLALWTAWLDYCAATGAEKAASRVAARALALHPRAAPLWAAAAAWAAGRGRDPAAARALMQRGLRACAGDEGLWVEYVRFELRAAAALRARRAVLSGRESGAGDDAGATQAEPDAPSPAASWESDAAASASSSSEAEAESGGARTRAAAPTDAPADPASDEETDAATQAVLDGGVAVVVARGALAAAPRSVGLRAALLAALAESAHLPAAADAADAIYADLDTALIGDPAAAALAARRPLGPFARAEARGAAAALAAFDAALEATPSEMLADEYLALIKELAGEAGAEEAAPAPAPKRARCRAAAAAAPPPDNPLSAVALACRVESVCEAAACAGAASEAALLAWPRAALARGDAAAALAAAAVGTAATPESVPLWRARLALVAAAGDAAGGETVGAVALAALAALGRLATAAPVLADALDAAAAAGDETTIDALCASVVDAARPGPAGPARGGAGAAAAAAVRTATAVGGAPRRRALVEALRRGPSPGGDFWEAVLEAEAAEVAAPLPDAALTRLFHEATAATAGDARPWLRHAAFARARGAGVGAVAWRAAKALTAADPAAAAEFDAGLRAQGEARAAAEA